MTGIDVDEASIHKIRTVDANQHGYITFPTLKRTPLSSSAAILTVKDISVCSEKVIRNRGGATTEKLMWRQIQNSLGHLINEICI